MSIVNLPENEQPLLKKNWDKNGSYKTILLASKTKIAPNGEFKIELYVTGYGKIENPKVIISVPYSLVDEGSHLMGDFVIESDGVARIGGRKIPLGNNKDFKMTTIQLPTLRLRTWKENTDPTLFIDTDSYKHSTGIMAEQKWGENAPMNFYIKTKPNAPPGDYDFQFYLTYFNGTEWVTERDIIKISVTSFIQRHDSKGWIIALLAGIAGIAGLIPIIQSIYKLLYD